MFIGSLVALITPFRQGAIDYSTIESLVEWHIQQGTRGIVPCGTTGEAFMLTPEERMRVIETCVQAASGNVPVIPGTGAITTEETISLTQQAKIAGADAVLIVTPPYIKPSQEGLYQHYKAVHDAVEIPIILYNNPGRTSIELKHETVIKLAHLPRIVAIKDSSGDWARPLKTRYDLGPKFCQLAGDDTATVAFLANGGHGTISVIANIAPKACAELYEAWQLHDLTTVGRIRDQLYPLCDALFIETNPGPIKYAASLLELCSADLRPPLVPISAATSENIKRAMQTSGLFESFEQRIQ
ncbi:MAG: 4-hydroxy-tetrahydrodipicolinate synthase [Alphaproteobacteria bacterium]|nr:4-hydroxy-tetrahydrodipicolinate synthase [Alphaproteobacteria bacterium]